MRTYSSCVMASFASEFKKQTIMLYLCYNSITRNLSIESRASSDLNVLISPFVLENKKNKDYDIVVPDTNFRIRLYLHYGSSSQVVLSDNGRDFFWLGALVHSKHLASHNISINDKRLNETLVTIKDEKDEAGWTNCYNVIIELFNNRSTWQVNETFKMVNDLNMLFSADSSFSANLCHRTEEFEGSELEILKINKIYSAIVLFQKCCMTNLFGAKESIFSLAEKALPLLKKVYFEKLEEIDAFRPIYIDIKETRKKYVEVKTHQMDYIDFMLKNKYSLTEENAKARFKSKYSKEFQLLDTFDEKEYYTSSSKWARINNEKQVVEECYKCVFDFMLQEGKFKEYLTAAGTVL